MLNMRTGNGTDPSFVVMLWMCCSSSKEDQSNIGGKQMRNSRSQVLYKRTNEVWSAEVLSIDYLPP